MEKSIVPGYSNVGTGQTTHRSDVDSDFAPSSSSSLVLTPTSTHFADDFAHDLPPSYEEALRATQPRSNDNTLLVHRLVIRSSAEVVGADGEAERRWETSAGQPDAELWRDGRSPTIAHEVAEGSHQSARDSEVWDEDLGRSWETWGETVAKRAESWGSKCEDWSKRMGEHAERYGEGAGRRCVAEYDERRAFGPNGLERGGFGVRGGKECLGGRGGRRGYEPFEEVSGPLNHGLEPFG
ncbi:hypothetical protein LTS18_002960 [Coniosporium uncinatum]|uniref:Uncharacterized protein n=1 Tax=Coniosporium uncinatum TaxID=93489 RepID=A0ACC3D7H8_9PEZI|nr:hypothetical protein LTS18_002960 [Coniosporium uncinatum]